MSASSCVMASRFSFLMMLCFFAVLTLGVVSYATQGYNASSRPYARGLPFRERQVSHRSCRGMAASQPLNHLAI